MNDRPARRFDMNETEIDTLALHQCFGDLNAGDQERVLAQLGSEDAYEQLRCLLLALMLRPSNPTQQPVVQERVVYVPMGEAQLAEGEREEIVRRVTNSVREQIAKQAEAQPVVHAASTAEPVVRAASPTESVTNRVRNRLRDSGIEKASRETPIPATAPGNQFVGLANLPQLDIQKRGKSLAEDSSSRQVRWTAGRDSF